MSVPGRIASLVTTRSKIVLVVLLLSTAVFGAGMGLVEEDSSLEQFESDSPEGQAAEEIDDRFGTDEAETTVQLIHRGDNETNVVDQAVLLEALRFQEAIHENESINETLVEDDPITGVENIVAITAVTQQTAEELTERGEELGEREAELEARSDTLEAGLDETREIQREFEELNATTDETDPEYQQEAAELEAAFETTLEETVEAGDLDDEQATAYEESTEQAREIEASLFELEQATDDPDTDPAYQELQDDLEGVYAAGTVGVLEEEYDQLEADFEAFEEDQAALDDLDPSLEEQIEALEEADDERFEDALEATLSTDDNETNEAPGLGFMPSDYEPGSTEADARMTAISQEVGDADLEFGAADDAVLETQLEIRDLAGAPDHEYVVFGVGIISDEIDRSMADSLAVVGPLALAFVVATLFVAYRDPLDIVLGVAGIITVLVWTFGVMGWSGIAFNQMFVAVPVLLIGLSIDYAIHVFMRYRERRETVSSLGQHAANKGGGEPVENGPKMVRGSMTVALAGVGVALVWVTATTAIGFLANLVSPIGPIQEFAVVSAVGILAALVVFGGLVPAAKVELDSALERAGFDRHKRAFGTGGGRMGEFLAAGAVGARRAPFVVIVAVLLLTAGGVYGASQVDTSFEEEDFLAESPPKWTQTLPDVMAPGEYQAADDLEYVNENFQREDLRAQILVEGDVADGEVLHRLETAQDEAGASAVTYTQADGEADVDGPLSLLESTAAENESFNESYEAADTTGDGVPDENVSGLYDELFEIDETEASQVIHRTDDGSYDSARLLVSVEGEAAFGETTEEMRAIAATLEDDGITAIATGDPIVNYVVEQDLFETVIQSLLVTLVAVFGFLTVAYWVTGNGAALGAVTLLPVAFAVSWILGTMYLLEIPFNVLTGMITSLTIGLGVAYSIHVSARYSLELERQGNVWSALETTVTGTGGALLGSAATTVGGFGTLAFAILPVLRQFGIITGLTVTYAFLSSVVVLPSLLVLWTRYLGPDVSFDRTPVTGPSPTASDGGRPASESANEGSDEEADGPDNSTGGKR